jgi:hypothetical protein
VAIVVAVVVIRVLQRHLWLLLFDIRRRLEKLNPGANVRFFKYLCKKTGGKKWPF